jgi:uncharacterized tellurite resistance protein B-like protein
MLKTLKDLFDALVPPSAAPDPSAAEHALQLATAVLLVEVMRADATVRADERESVHAALRDKFGLTTDEAEQLAKLAETTSQRATDLFSFTSGIDEHFDMPQKVRIIEHMWRVAYADGVLSAHERHVLWRIADLLHVPQNAYVNARLRAEQER